MAILSSLPAIGQAGDFSGTQFCCLILKIDRVLMLVQRAKRTRTGGTIQEARLGRVARVGAVVTKAPHPAWECISSHSPMTSS